MNERSAKIPQQTGVHWYVDPAGDDTNAGTSPDSPYLTIGKAISVANPGDTIHVGRGTYTETGLDVNIAALCVRFAMGVIIDPASGTALVVSGDNCRIGERDYTFVVTPATATPGVQVTGQGCLMFGARVMGSNIATGIDIDAPGCELDKCFVSGCDNGEVAFDLVGQTKLYDCSTVGSGTSTGYKVTGANGLMVGCGSVGHETAGFNFDSNSSYWTARHCTSGGGDGSTVDEGTRNKVEIDDQLALEHHEDVYPKCDGEGSAAGPVSVDTDSDDETNAKSATQYYWGEPFVLVPQSAISERWWIDGLNFFGNTTGKEFQYETFPLMTEYTTAKNGGAAWDEGATVLTVTDGSIFQTGDLVWVYSAYKTNGEIVRVTNVAVNVITVERETVAAGVANTGLRWDHTTNNPGTETMTLMSRSGDNRFSGHEGHYSCASSRDFASTRFHDSKEMKPDSGYVMRVVNLTDSNNGAGFDVAVIYED